MLFFITHLEKKSSSGLQFHQGHTCPRLAAATQLSAVTRAAAAAAAAPPSWHSTKRRASRWSKGATWPRWLWRSGGSQCKWIRSPCHSMSRFTLA